MTGQHDHELRILAPAGIGEIVDGTDLAALIAGALDLVDGDIVCVTSKVVSKAEGRLVTGDRDAAIDSESVRTVAQRGTTRIVRHRLGLTMAAAGVDASNVEVGRIVVLPEDPDASAAGIRARLAELTGANVGVIVTDTFGRPWRMGQTDVAIGVAGVPPLESYAGSTDAYGNPLAVTEPALADEIAGAAELAAGKLSGRPFVLVRGRGDLVLAPGDDGPGAAALIRPETEDMFPLGPREAIEALRAGEDIDWLMS